MASIGPLETFVFPGVYTRTSFVAEEAGPVGNLRYPAFVGVTKETVDTLNYALVRGSSSTTDNIIIGETISSTELDGSKVEFTVAKAPIVDGSGAGKHATTSDAVVVTVNGEKVRVLAVDGLAGTFRLATPPLNTDVVEVSYYFKRRDTYVQAEDVSAQADGTATVFKLANRVVDGTNGGMTATNAALGSTVMREINGVGLVTTPVIAVTVNGAPVEVAAINGGDHEITLKAAPLPGDLVEVNYFTSSFQNSFDYLPGKVIQKILSVGNAEGRVDYRTSIQGVQGDYTLANGNEIHWGKSAAIEGASIRGVAADTYTVSGIITKDVTVAGYLATSVDGVLTVGLPIVDGTGSGTMTENPSAVEVYTDSSNKSGTIKAVRSIKGNTITLVDAGTQGPVFVDFKTDNTSHADLIASVNADGNIQVMDEARGAFLGFGQTGAPADLSVGYFNKFFSTGSPITISVTANGGKFDVASDSNYVASISDLEPNQYYYDANSGVGFQVTGVLSFEIATELAVPTSAAVNTPGAEFVITKDSTPNATTAINASSLVRVIDLRSSREPAVGNTYYVSVRTERVDYSTKIYSSFTEVEKAIGKASLGNPLALACSLAFANGAPVVAIKPIKRAAGQSDASDAEYIKGIEAFNVAMPDGSRPSVVQALTTSSAVTDYLRTSNAVQSSIRYRNERVSYVGAPLGTTPNLALDWISGLGSNLIIPVYPDSAAINITDENGTTTEEIVGAEFIAAAMAGLDTTSAFDYAEPLLNKRLAGFSRMGRRMDEPTALMVAGKGGVFLETQGTSTVIKSYFSSDLSSALTRDPRVTEVSFQISRETRNLLSRYIGKKQVDVPLSTVKEAMRKFMKNKVDSKIIAAVKSVVVKPNPLSPTTYDVEVIYSPTLPLNWILVSFQVQLQA